MLCSWNFSVIYLNLSRQSIVDIRVTHRNLKQVTVTFKPNRKSTCRRVKFHRVASLPVQYNLSREGSAKGCSALSKICESNSSLSVAIPK